MTAARNGRERGFTLVEVLVAVLIASVVVVSIFRIFSSTKTSYQRGTENIDGQQNARAALTWLARELRSAKGFSSVTSTEVTFLTDTNVPNQIRTFRLDDADLDGDGDFSELLLIRNPADDGTPGVYFDEIALGIDSLQFVYRDAQGNETPSRTTVRDVEVFIFAKGNSMRDGAQRDVHGARQVAMSTRVRCRNVGKSVPSLGDETAPNPPTGLAVVVGCGTATLSWDASSEEDLAGYYLSYVEGSGPPFGGTAADQGPSPIFVGSSTSYTLTGLDRNASYSFGIQATDAADNVSGFGSTTSGIPSDDLDPSTPTNLTARVVGNDAIYLTWSPSPEWDVTEYWMQWYPDSNPSAVTGDDVPGTAVTIDGLLKDEIYHCSVAAIDGCGNTSPLSSEITITMVPCDEDTGFPDAPTSVASIPGDEFVRLTWSPVPDTDVVGYQVYFQRAGTTDGSTLLVGNVDSYSVYGLENGTAYEFQVAAIDGCSHLSGYSGMESATPYHCADNSTPPDVPANLTVVDLGNGSSVKLSWTARSEGDVLGYKVYWGESPTSWNGIEDVGDDVFHTIDGLLAGNTYYFSVSSYDVCGNESLPAPAVSAIPSWGCLCPPVASITTPAQLATVTGTVDWWADAAACSTASIQHVEFRIDGVTEYVDYTNPYRFGDFGSGWDTTFEPDGPRKLVAIAVDDAGCETADSISVFVDNNGMGAACVGILATVDPHLTGPFDEIVRVTAQNLSDVGSYDLSGVKLDWSGADVALEEVRIDEIAAWSGRAYSGEAVELDYVRTIPAGGNFVVEFVFGNDPAQSPPALDLVGFEFETWFLGLPVEACGPYDVVVPDDCLPTVAISEVNSSNPYDVYGPPAVGTEYYTDRSYSITSMPPDLSGTVLVRTPNNDKNKGGSLRLKLDFEQDVTVYIAYDSRGTPPNWIKNNFTDTGLTIGVTDSGTPTLDLWRGNKSAGIRTFKGNKAKGWSGSVGTNYVIFVKCQESGGATL